MYAYCQLETVYAVCYCQFKAYRDTFSEFMEKMLLTPAETAQMLGICRATAYRLIVSNRLPAVRVGGLWRVPSEALRGWIERQLREGTATGKT